MKRKKKTKKAASHAPKKEIKKTKKSKETKKTVRSAPKKGAKKVKKETPKKSKKAASHALTKKESVKRVPRLRGRKSPKTSRRGKDLPKNRKQLSVRKIRPGRKETPRRVRTVKKVSESKPKTKRKRPTSQPAVPVSKWIRINEWLNNLKSEFDLVGRRIDKPSDELHWVREENGFVFNVRQYPPYGGDGYYVMISVWFVVHNSNEDENFLWIRSRAKGMEVGMPWGDIAQLIKDLEADIESEIERKDYLELIKFVGWTAYPLSEWYKREKAKGNI